MAVVELIEGTMIGKFTITAEEALDIRKHALECAVHALPRDRKQPQDIDYLLRVAKQFEAHLSRNTNDG